MEAVCTKKPQYANSKALLEDFIDLVCGPLDVTMDKVSASQEGGSKWMEDDRKCDNCGVIMKLRYANDAEIIVLGLTVNDYEYPFELSETLTDAYSPF